MKKIALTKKKKKQSKAFQKAVEPLMKYLAKNYHPHTKCIVENNIAELVEGIEVHNTDKFILD